MSQQSLEKLIRIAIEKYKMEYNPEYILRNLEQFSVIY